MVKYIDNKGTKMKVDLEKESNNIAKVEIEIPAKDGVDAYNKAVKRYANYVNIPGFRKGKAPRNIIERNVGVDRIKNEALEILLPEVFRNVISENKLDVISQPTVEKYEFEVGKDIKLSAKIELRPEVKLETYKDMTVDVEEFKQEKDAFDKSLENLLMQSAKLELVVDRPTKSDDIIVFDFDGYSNGEKIEHGDAKNYTLDLAHSSFIPGFAEQLVDRKLGEEFEINVTFPETYHEKKLAGQPATFKCKINEIKTKVLPELNDEFAQKVGPFKTVDDLKADIKNYLEKQEETTNKQNADKAIFEKVIENAEVEISDSMIERESNSLLEEYKQKLTAQGFTWEQAVETQGLDNIMEKIREDAKFRIKNSLVIDKIASLENLKVEPADFDEKMETLAGMYQMDRETFTKYMFKNPGMLNSLSQQVLNEKVMKFLSDNNKVNFVKAKK